MTGILFYIACVLLNFTSDNPTRQKNKIESGLLDYSQFRIKVSQYIFRVDSGFLQTGLYYVSDSSNGIGFNLYKSDRKHYLDPKPLLTAKNFKTIETYEAYLYGKKYSGFKIHLDRKGAKSWSRAIGRAKLTGTNLAFVLDNKLLLVMEISSHIGNSVVDINRGDFSVQEVENFKKVIESEK
jgi:hypothetical protein